MRLVFFKYDLLKRNTVIMVQYAASDGEIVNFHGNDHTHDISHLRFIPILHTGDLFLQSSDNHFQVILSYSTAYLLSKVDCTNMMHCDVIAMQFVQIWIIMIFVFL